jgi:hypothetical protein
MDFLYSLSNLELIAFTCVLFVVLFLLLTLIFRKTPVGHLLKEDTVLVMEVQNTLFTVCGLILAFSLVQVVGNLKKVDEQVTQEAIQINNFDRMLLLASVPDLPVGEARKLLIDYARSVTGEEWRAISQGESIDLINFYVAQLSKLVRSASHSADYGEIMNQLKLLANARDTRIELARLALPDIFWGTILMTVLISIIISALLAVTRIKTFVMGCQVLILGLLVSVVYINDNPFKGETSITPDAINRVIAIMQMRT